MNRELILLYWDLGDEIVAKLEKPGWGKSVVERLASDLKSTFPDQQGFSTSNLWRMQQLVRLFSEPKYLAQAVREMVALIPWGHHVAMLSKMGKPEEHFYYLCAEKDDIEVEFALKSKGNPIGVAEYQLKSRLPISLKGKIPTAEELKKVLRERGNQINQN